MSIVETDEQKYFDAVLGASDSLNVSDARFVVWDTETTGASRTNDFLVEIGAIAFDEDYEHRRFETLVKPPIPIPHFVTKIHGITDPMVKHAPDGREALTRMFEFLDWVGRPRILLAHNAGFDVGMVHTNWSKLEHKPKGKAAREIVLDTCMLAKTLLPELSTHRLEALAQHFKVPEVRFHRAMEDVKALYHVFMGLLGLAADRMGSRPEGLTIGSLIDLAGGYFLMSPGDSEAQRRPFRLPPRIAQLERLCGTESRVGVMYEVEDDYRYITPIAVRIKSFKVYVEAYCHRDNIKKTFRADKILRIGRIEVAEVLSPELPILSEGSETP